MEEELREERAEAEEEEDQAVRTLNIPKNTITNLINRLSGQEKVTVTKGFKEATNKAVKTFLFYVLTKYSVCNQCEGHNAGAQEAGAGPQGHKAGPRGAGLRRVHQAA